jgi:SAM-dependent methyltransferase
MTYFTRDDGVKIQIVDGFRERILGYRRALSPREAWSAADYAEAIRKKRKRFRRLVRQARALGFELKGQRVLDVGCGDASTCVLFAQNGATVDGIDLQPLLLNEDEKGGRARGFVAQLLELPGPEQLPAALNQLPIRVQRMDATAMRFADATFDFVMSRSAMEHVRPLEKTLSEIVRITRPGGLIYLSIDPFYWVRGCHKRGVVDIPWAHARLTSPEFHRFVSETEGEAVARKRVERWETLNRLTLAQWRERIAAIGCAVLEWTEDFSAVGETILHEHPDVSSTLLPGVSERDLLHERIKVWLRRTP